MTRNERRTVAAAYGFEPRKRGHGKHSVINDVARIFGGMEGIERPRGNLSINGSSEGVIFSRTFRPARRNGYDGHPVKPNRAYR